MTMENNDLTGSIPVPLSDAAESGIPAQVAPPVPPKEDVVQPVPQTNPMEDESVTDDIDLETIVKPSPTEPEVPEVQKEQDDTTDEKETARSIWDDCEVDDIPSENLANVAPVFHREETDVGTDIALPATNASNLLKISEGKQIQTEEDFLWFLNNQQASLLAIKDTILSKRLGRPGSDWAQNVPLTDPTGRPFNGSFLTSGAKQASSANQKLEGPAALERFMQGTTMGSPVTVPLTNTGIWVRLQPAGASFLAELDRKLAYARMQVGLNTNGLTGAVDDLIFREIINEAALKLVSACNYPVNDPMELRSVIDDEDSKTLSWALAKLLNPKGIMVSIPCIDPECVNIDTFRANPARMHFIDRSKLNEKQRKFLGRGISRQMTLDDINAYKAEFVRTAKYSKRVNNREFIFRSPTIEQKLEIGRSWLSTVNQAVDAAMGKDVTNDVKRSEVINQITSIEQVCNWGHYIEEIRIYNDDSDDIDNFYSITGEDEIRSILKTLSTAPDIIDSLIEGIEEFLIEIGTTIIGYPNVDCEKCHHANVPEKFKNKLLLPFDPDTGFFILAQRKIFLAGGEALTDLTTFGTENLAPVQMAPEQQVSLGEN